MQQPGNEEDRWKVLALVALKLAHGRHWTRRPISPLERDTECLASQSWTSRLVKTIYVFGHYVFALSDATDEAVNLRRLSAPLQTRLGT